MSEQTTLTEFDRTALLTDGGRAVAADDAADDHPHFDADAETVTDAWEGAFIYTSWGYGQTNTNFAQIVEVSDTGKTVRCRMVAAEAVDRGRTSESVRPTAEQYGDTFRLHVRACRDEPVFRGSYPYIDGEKETGTRKGSFSVFDNAEGKTVHQTAPNRGH